MSSKYVADTFTHNGYKVQLIADQDAEAPNNDEADLFIVTTRNRYFQLLHEDEDAQTVVKDKDLCKRYWIFPLYAYIHSGVALSLGRGGQFSDPWDSAQIGFVFVEKSSWKYRTRETKKVSSALKACEAYVEAWKQYLSGDVWGYTIETPDGEHIDSCWGFYGLEYAKSEAIACVPDAPALVNGESEDESMEETLA